MNATTYEDYEQNYQACLTRIRGHLATGTRTQELLVECHCLLVDARKYATAMQGMAEIENNSLRIQIAKTLVERDIDPLSKEVKRTLEQFKQRTELFPSSATVTAAGVSTIASTQQYRSPDIEQQQQQPYYAYNYNNNNSNNNNNNNNSANSMDSIIFSSEELLRDSQALLSETEQIGTETLLQMGRQREQIYNSRTSLESVQNATIYAGLVLKSMSSKALKNKVCLYFMIIFLTIANVFVLYCMYKKHHRST